MKVLGTRILVLIAFALLVPSGRAQVSVVGELTRESRGKPGETLKGVVLLQNSSDKPASVKIYQTDYLCYADGRNLYGDPGTIARSNAKWVTVSPNRLTIPPKQTGTANYTVQLPPDSALKGTYWSMVMVEPVGEGNVEFTPEKLAKNELVKFGIRTVMRYGLQIVVDIGNTGTRQLKFLDRKLISQGGKRYLQLDIENTGERWLKPTVWAELFNSEGASAGRFDGGQIRVFPGCSIRQRVDLTPVPKGKYKTMVIFDNGDESVFGAQYDLLME
ncbi:MAG: hypothetical protein HY815_33690 [Candidatus Riflebacteria bacterium]|nr:hypothetical protein [Candidatus Riflebacteria bacterium]